jgi:hypothetical protein
MPKFITVIARVVISHSGKGDIYAPVRINVDNIAYYHTTSSRLRSESSNEPFTEIELSNRTIFEVKETPEQIDYYITGILARRIGDH